MVLNFPVKEFYGIDSDSDAIDIYGRIIQVSQSYAKSSGISMWYINRAYVIHNNGDTIHLKRINNKCSHLTKNRRVHI